MNSEKKHFKRYLFLSLFMIMIFFSSITQVSALANNNLTMGQMYVFQDKFQTSLKNTSDNSLLSYTNFNSNEYVIFDHFNKTSELLHYWVYTSPQGTGVPINTNISTVYPKDTKLFDAYFYENQTSTHDLYLLAPTDFFSNLFSNNIPIVLNNNWTSLNTQLKGFFNNSEKSMYRYRSGPNAGHIMDFETYLTYFDYFAFDGSTNVTKAVNSLSNQRSWSIEYRTSNKVYFQIGNKFYPYSVYNVKESLSYNDNGMLNSYSTDIIETNANTTYALSQNVTLSSSKSGLPGFDLLTVAFTLMAIPIIIKLKKKF